MPPIQLEAATGVAVVRALLPPCCCCCNCLGIVVPLATTFSCVASYRGCIVIHLGTLLVSFLFFCFCFFFCCICCCCCGALSHLLLHGVSIKLLRAVEANLSTELKPINNLRQSLAKPSEAKPSIEDRMSSINVHLMWRPGGMPQAAVCPAVTHRHISGVAISL